MKKKRIKQGSAVLLALAVVTAAWALPETRAAYPIDTGASCSVEFSVSGEYDELTALQIPIRLYKVADVDESGAFTPLAGFETLELAGVAGGEGSAEEWSERAEEAAGLVTEELQETASVVTDGGAAVKEELSTGLYLVMAETVQSAYYTYHFTPYLISLPNHYYYSTQDDTWVYDLTGANAVGLKPEQAERYGELQIKKSLETHNMTTDGKATFVFRIDIETLKGETESRLVTLQFGGDDNDMEHTEGMIPAGSTVRVTEVYSGGGYELSAESAQEQVVTIIAEEIVPVTFINEHNDKEQGGYGVVNHYELDENGQYQWSSDSE